jgi:hypothetical protein
MPGIRCSGRKGGSWEPWMQHFPQVDSVLSADGRRPVRRKSVYRTRRARWKAQAVLLCLSMRFAVIVLLLSSAHSFAQSKVDSFDQLASDFWTWRAQHRPFTFDDVPRTEHAGGVRDWSAASIANQRLELAAFERRLKALPADSWPLAQRVDHRLMGSAMARVRWELDVNPRWQATQCSTLSKPWLRCRRNSCPLRLSAKPVPARLWRERRTFRPSWSRRRQI